MKNSFALYTHEYNGQKFDFVITRNARIEIEELELNSMEGFTDADSFASIMDTMGLKAKIDNAKEVLSKAKADKKEELQRQIDEMEARLNQGMMKMLPNLKEITKSQNKTQDEYEIAKIILMNYRGNGDMTSNLADEILEDMELSMGFEAFENKLLEIIDIVFTQIKKIQDHKQEIFDKKNKESKMTIPMS